jgi:hypothetical protein
MHVIVGIPETVFNSENDRGQHVFLAELRQAAQALGTVESIEPTPAGMGADFPSYLVQFAIENWEALVAALYAGEKVAKVVEGWEKFAKLVKRTVEGVRRQFVCTIDYEVAGVLACEALAAENPGITIIRVKSVSVIDQLSGQSRVIPNPRVEWPIPNRRAKTEADLLKLRAFNSAMQMNNYVFLLDLPGRGLYSVVVESDGLVRTPVRIAPA